ncbi:MAG TPA: sulfate adenylyltransferase [Firmicutes bacterium]|nr:sulfate adenylyltransferase [Bacillota bacterium]
MFRLFPEELVNRWMDERTARLFQEEVSALPGVVLNEREEADLKLLASGAYTPLRGFMDQDDYLSVLARCRLADGRVWTLPITLAVAPEKIRELPRYGPVALHSKIGELLGCLFLTKIYKRNLREEARLVYGTADQRHPGVAGLFKEEEYLAGGKVLVLRRPENYWSLPWEPAETRKAFKEFGWKKVVGFQTRNPIHRAHEYLQKTAMEMVDGLFLHPLVGVTKEDDLPPEIRLSCYRVLLENYYPRDRVLLGVFPAAMRYAGPREAVFHALVRKNYGCTHMIIGRDHAGAGEYYRPDEAQDFCEQFGDELGITILRFDNAFYCRRCGQTATARTCPHPQNLRLSLSGTRIRELLEKGEMLPAEFTRPEVAEILRDYYLHILTDAQIGQDAQKRQDAQIGQDTKIGQDAQKRQDAQTHQKSSVGDQNVTGQDRA